MKWIGQTTNGNFIIEMTQREWAERLSDDVDNLEVAMKNHRATSGKSQAEMAAIIGCSRTYYSMIERGVARNYSHNIYQAILAELPK